MHGRPLLRPGRHLQRPVTLKLLVVLVALALLARRFLPRYRLSWYVPLVLGVTIVVVRGLAYALDV